MGAVALLWAAALLAALFLSTQAADGHTEMWIWKERNVSISNFEVGWAEVAGARAFWRRGLRTAAAASSSRECQSITCLESAHVAAASRWTAAAAAAAGVTRKIHVLTSANTFVVWHLFIVGALI